MILYHETREKEKQTGQMCEDEMYEKGEAKTEERVRERKRKRERETETERQRDREKGRQRRENL